MQRADRSMNVWNVSAGLSLESTRVGASQTWNGLIVIVEERMLFSVRRWLVLGVCLLLLAACGVGDSGAARPTITPPATMTVEATTVAALTERPTVTPAAPATPTADAAVQPSAIPATVVSQPTAESPVTGATGSPKFTRRLAVQTPFLEGDDVRAVQQRLIDLGYMASDGADGIFGPRTRETVSLFQSLNNLEQDGIVGEATWATLFSDQALSIQEDMPVPTGGRIIFIKPDGVTLASIKPEGTDEQLLPQFLVKGQQIINLSADPTGSYIAYTASFTTNENINLYIATIDGSLLATYEGLSGAQFSPDGTRFISSVVSASGDASMVVRNTEQAGAAPLAQFSANAADWSADGSTIIFVSNSNIFTYNLVSGETTQITNLPSEGDDTWYVDEAHFSPDGARIYFYAGQRKNTGASGNGLQWWVMPSAGGSAGCSQRFEGCGEPVAFTAAGGNGVGEFAFNMFGDVMAYTEGFHVSACSSVQNVFTRTTNDQESPVAAFTEEAADGGQYIRGLHWDPSGTQLVFGFITYRCSEDMGQQFADPPGVYIWNIATGGAPVRITDGSFPIWLP